MTEAAPNLNHNQPIYSISEVSQSLKRMVEDHFGQIRLRGEISGWKVASSGHVYFRLKDDNAVIDAICWKGTAGKLAFKPEDGLEVVARGKMTTYPGRSSYQIVIDQMEPAGAGALMAILEKRKAALAAEGLFAAERKKKIPFLPRVVGVVTSPTGAVIRDILHRIEDRFPLHVLVWPVKVQGEGAAEQIAAAINGFNALAGAQRPDVLIVARGGGSIEDLWAFNEEIVVRAAANSTIPLISAVGHETDTTLIDFASDQRAPTPTAAAEMAVPVRAELQLGIKQLDARLSAAMVQTLARSSEKLIGLARGLPRPAELLNIATQKLDDWSERLNAALPMLVARKEQQLAVLTAGLRPQALLAEVSRTAQKTTELSSRMNAAITRSLSQKKEKLEAFASLLESVNYQKVLARGFALVRGEGGALVTSAAQAQKNTALEVTFADGTVTVRP
ncbi:MAG: exodeoxyribonuclease VII large subunit [Alphaproteobacteria bacterium]|nr:exodeoxyribonuclease VII large subunit [Alphaproteobacteria bacterium]